MGIKRPSLTAGMKFGRLTVVEYAYSVLRRNGKAGERVMKCRCECGKEIEARTSNLYSGNTLSCGCLHSDRTIKSNIKRGQPVLRQEH